MKYCYIRKRKCYKCKKVKSRTEFYKDSYDKYGLQASCKECHRLQNKKYFKANKEYFKQKGKEHYKKENNPSRYQKYRKKMLIRRKQYSESAVGRFNTLLNSAKARAKKQKLKYQLNIDWILDQYKQQKKKCKLTGILLEFKTNIKRKRQYMPFSPSLHRKNPKEGYTKENTVLVCTAINIALNRFSAQAFNKMIEGYIKTKRRRI